MARLKPARLGPALLGPALLGLALGAAGCGPAGQCPHEGACDDGLVCDLDGTCRAPSLPDVRFSRHLEPPALRFTALDEGARSPADVMRLGGARRVLLTFAELPTRARAVSAVLTLKPVEGEGRAPAETTLLVTPVVPREGRSLRRVGPTLRRLVRVTPGRPVHVDASALFEGRIDRAELSLLLATRGAPLSVGSPLAPRREDRPRLSLWLR